MQKLYKETLGKATITLSKQGDMYILGLVDTDLKIDREKMFNPTAYEDDRLSDALKQYDATCDHAARMYNVARTLPEPPDFTKVITL